MTKTNRRRLLITAIVVVSLAGCSKDHLDPSQIGRFRTAPAVNVILDSLGVAEETATAYEGAEEPKATDVIAREEDYAFSSGDTIRISIFELLQEGYPYVDNFIVSESGNISIPEVGQVQAGGLTETQLEEEIRNALSPGILKNPSLTVSLVSSLSRVFTVLGDGVSTPGRYAIPRYDFRLMDALAVAGSAHQFNVSYIYVARKVTGTEAVSEQSGAETQMELKSVDPGVQADDNTKGNQHKVESPDKVNKDMLEIIEPSFSRASSNGLVIASAEMITKEQLENLAAPDNVGEPQVIDGAATVNTMPEAQEQGRIEWVFRDGKWVPVKVGQESPTKTEQPRPEIQQEKPKQIKPEVKPVPNKEYGIEDIQTAGIQSKVIRIPKDKLYGGDPRYNIVIKPQDTITVQLDVIGEFYVLGNVNNQGVINLTGRPMTLKMAIAAAGGLGPLAWPKKCEVIRRVGEKKEEIVMVDLEKISSGTQPDFFIKPNDVINVGTHGISRYLAVLRNAFRATYGFGFIYDRNFSNRPLMLDQPGRLFDNSGSL